MRITQLQQTGASVSAFRGILPLRPAWLLSFVVSRKENLTPRDVAPTTPASHLTASEIRELGERSRNLQKKHRALG
jgi:hypothetical protein